MNAKSIMPKNNPARAVAAPVAGAIAAAMASLACPLQTCAAADCATSTCDICVESGEVRVVTSGESANCIDVESGGAFNIDPNLVANATLTLGSCAAGLTSTVDGEIRLLDDADGSLFARLSFATVNHTVTGSGKIKGKDNLALINVASGVTLTSDLKIVGHLRITGAGTFINDGAVIADSCGTIDMLVTTIDDTAGSCRWQVKSSSLAKLLFSVTPAALAGDFCVSNGTLEAGIGGDTVAVDTSGCLTHGPAGEIVVGQNDSFSFCPAVR